MTGKRGTSQAEASSDSESEAGDTAEAGARTSSSSKQQKAGAGGGTGARSKSGAGAGTSAGLGAGSAASKIFRPRPQFPPIGNTIIITPTVSLASPIPPSENRRCPVPGCDSSGHLSGRLGRHFTAEACPVFHNTTPAACTQASHDTSKRDAARRKAVLQLASKSPLTSPSHEHRR